MSNANCAVWESLQEKHCNKMTRGTPTAIDLDETLCTQLELANPASALGLKEALIKAIFVMPSKAGTQEEPFKDTGFRLPLE